MDTSQFARMHPGAPLTHSSTTRTTGTSNTESEDVFRASQEEASYRWSAGALQSLLESRTEPGSGAEV
jgi:hypothetical protein